jgi:alpha/beta superfamily hydrolase
MTINGPAGNIEYRWDECAGARSSAVICHPHPLYGGSMHDAIVEAIHLSMFEQNISSLRFNFRGVGDSEGDHDQGEGEVTDVNFLLDWLRSEKQAGSVYLAGYSFGAIVALKAACSMASSMADIRQLFLVAPPLQMLAVPDDVPVPTTIIVGDRDQFVDFGSVERWAEISNPGNSFHAVAGADHFFSGFHQQIRSLVSEKLTTPGE